ncbi:hypothetical protein IFR04_001931 [Cadophora malorum]|uniref:F-box domain-containing protein n=1 Tax=Cadophora malorum TaxID=108018 RepID=A0A8H7WHK2_9HELO|nr:hypothetical protein IFR04_001931 [Cadophora malorum]
MLPSQLLSMQRYCPQSTDEVSPMITCQTGKINSFLDLPSEIRNAIYELCLLHQGPIRGLFAEDHPVHGLTSGLLRVNKAVHREASSFLYAQNCFDLTDAIQEADVTRLLGKIGCTNAGYIQHIITDFPEFDKLEPENVTLEKNSIDLFRKLKSGCTSLRTLTLSPDSTSEVLLKLDALDYPKVAIEALTLANSLLRSDTFVNDIVIEVYEHSLSGYLKRAMESDGWTIREIEDFEEDWGSVRSYGDGRDLYDDDWDNGYGYSESDDHYDDEYDSDFWRRAGD